MSVLPSVSVVIVSYNTKQLTCNCVQSVIDHGRNVEQQIIVFDNASSDGSADALSEKFPNIELVRSTKNLGFAKGNNEAAKLARGEYILLLNPDTIVLNKAIEQIILFAERNPKSMIWGGRTLHGDMTLNAGSCWRFMSLWTLFSSCLGLPLIFPNSDFFNSESYGAWQRDTERNVDMVSGCFLLIKREFWQRLGGFDETFFVFAEEADLCFRARKHGAAPKISPDATIVHLCGSSTTVRADKLELLWKGKATFVRKHWPVWKAKAGIALMSVHAMIRWLGYGALGVLPNHARHRQASREWRTLLFSRRKWENGFG